MALLTEVLAAALTGATPGIHASPFSGTVGGPPKTGQLFIAIDASATAGDAFSTRIADLVEAIRFQEGAHFPGDGRRAKRLAANSKGVAFNVATLEKIEALLT